MCYLCTEQNNKRTQQRLMFKYYLTLAWRNICRQKIQSLLSIVGLAVALSCFSIFAYLVYSLVFVDTWYENHDRVVHISRVDDENPLGYGNFVRESVIEGKLDSIPGIECYCNIESMTSHWTLEDSRSVILQTIEADTTLRHIFNPTLLAGSWEDALRSGSSFVMTRSFAQQLFGSPEAAIGQKMSHYGAAHTIRAVVEDLPSNNSMKPLSNIGGWTFNTPSQDYEPHFCVYILVKEGYTREEVRQSIDQLDLFDKESQDHYTVYWPNPWQWKFIAFFGVLFLIITLPAMLLLIAALSNFFHLLVSDIMLRQREYTLRRCHGAHTRDLWLMVSCYVTLMLVLTGSLSMLLIELCSPFFTLHLLNGYTFVLDLDQMIRQSSWHIAVLLIVGLVVAWLAVIRVRRRSLQESIKSRSGRRPGRHIGRNILLGYQLTLAVFFFSLMSALVLQLRCNRQVFLPQMTEQQQADCLVASLHGVVVTDELIDELKAIPDVLEVVRYKEGSPFGHNWNNNFLNEQGDTLQANHIPFTTECLQFLGEAVTQGRYAEAPQEVVVDEALLSQFGLQLGDVIQLSVILRDENGVPMVDERGFAQSDWRPHTIVGTVAQLPDRLNNNVVRRIFNSIYINDTKAYSNNLWIKCYPGKGAKVKALLNERWKDNTDEWWYTDHEDLKFTHHSSVKSFAQIIDEGEVSFREFLPFFLLLSALALTLTLIGIYSAVSVDTRFRRKEMAIRKINGAKAWQIAVCFIRLYVIELVVASAIAIPCTYMLIDTIITEIFRVPFAHGVLFYGGVLLIVITLIAITVGYQIWRISRIEPAQVVKEE